MQMTIEGGRGGMSMLITTNKTNYIYFESEATKTEKKHFNDAGYDLRCKEKITIQPGLS